MNEGKSKMCEVWEVTSRAEAARNSMSKLNFIAGELINRAGDEPEKGGCE